MTVLASAAFVALVVSACSSDPGDPYPDAASFCSSYADAFCQGVAPGCAVSADTCKSKAQAKCQADGASTGRAYQPSRAQDCIDKTKDLYGKKTYTADDEKSQLQTCGRVFAGKAQKNDACQIDFDCSGDMVCDKGVCADKTDKNLGDACNDPGAVCESSAYCGVKDSTSTLKFCVAKKQLDDLCPAGVPCADTLYCLGGVCKNKVDLGQPCAADTECKESTTPPYCEPFQKKCLPKYGLGTDSCKQLGGS